MSEPSPPAEEIERIAVPRDPPPPPGYVDPLGDSPALEGTPGPVPERFVATADAPRPRSPS